MPRPEGIQTLTIDNTSDGVVVVPNVPNALTDLVRIEIPPKMAYRLYSGEILKMKLFDALGNELPRATRIVLGVRKPGQRQIEEFFSTTYGPWRALAEQAQQRKENQGSLGINFGGPWLDVLERQTLVMQIEASAAVSWLNPGTFFETTVEEILL